MFAFHIRYHPKHPSSEASGHIFYLIQELRLSSQSKRDPGFESQEFTYSPHVGSPLNMLTWIYFAFSTIAAFPSLIILCNIMFCISIR